MKKNIILGIACLVMSLQHLIAQDTVQASAAVSRSFEESFNGARNVSWTLLPKKITQAQFYYDGGSWLAYFDHTGKLITSGRRIKTIENLPLKVQAGLRSTKERMEKKSETFQIALMYEMLDQGVTKYFFSLQNSKTAATISINAGGTVFIENKRTRTPEPVVPTDAIAKKN